MFMLSRALGNVEGIVHYPILKIEQADGGRAWQNCEYRQGV